MSVDRAPALEVDPLTDGATLAEERRAEIVTETLLADGDAAIDDETLLAAGAAGTDDAVLADGRRAEIVAETLLANGTAETDEETLAEAPRDETDGATLLAAGGAATDDAVLLVEVGVDADCLARTRWRRASIRGVVTACACGVSTTRVGTSDGRCERMCRCSSGSS